MGKEDSLDSYISDTGEEESEWEEEEEEEEDSELSHDDDDDDDDEEEEEEEEDIEDEDEHIKIKKERPRLCSATSLIWNLPENQQPQKVRLSLKEIMDRINAKIQTVKPKSLFYHRMGLACSVATCTFPSLFRICWNFNPLQLWFFDMFVKKDYENCSAEALSPFQIVFGETKLSFFLVFCCAFNSLFVSLAFCKMFSVAEDTFHRRYLYAKYFAALTSSRRARKAGLPHFRLNKVEHIKIWLQLRSRRMETEKFGPQRAGDTIAQAIVLYGVAALFMCMVKIFQVTSEEAEGAWFSSVLDTYNEWILFLWTFMLSVFMLRLMTLASRTSVKYQNNTQLLTEQLNLHLMILEKPHLKDELVACNNVLKVAVKLIRELEGDKKQRVWHKALVNPFVYNLVRVLLLSTLGAISSEIIGFKIRLWKL